MDDDRRPKDSAGAGNLQDSKTGFTGTKRSRNGRSAPEYRSDLRRSNHRSKRAAAHGGIEGHLDTIFVFSLDVRRLLCAELCREVRQQPRLGHSRNPVAICVRDDALRDARKELHDHPNPITTSRAIRPSPRSSYPFDRQSHRSALCGDAGSGDGSRGHPS